MLLAWPHVRLSLPFYLIESFKIPFTPIIRGDRTIFIALIILFHALFLDISESYFNTKIIFGYVLPDGCLMRSAE